MKIDKDSELYKSAVTYIQKAMKELGPSDAAAITSEIGDFFLYADRSFSVTDFVFDAAPGRTPEETAELKAKFGPLYEARAKDTLAAFQASEN